MSHLEPNTPPRRRTPAFARYAALVAEALDGPAATDEATEDAMDRAELDAASEAEVATDGAVEPPWSAAVRSAACGLGRPTGGRPAPGPYEPAATMSPGDPAAAGGGERLDRRG